MANGNGSAFDKRVLWLLSILALAFGAWAGIDARVGATVYAEACERKDADKAIEQRLEKGLEDVRGELRELNRYLRERPE